MARSSDAEVRAGIDAMSDDDLAAVLQGAADAYLRRDGQHMERIREAAADARNR